MAFPSHMDPIEQEIVGALIRKALGLDYLVSIHDGEEWALVRSNDYAEIAAEIAATDETQLTFRLPDGKKVGWVYLVHGNGEDVISDHTDNVLINALVST